MSTVYPYDEVEAVSDAVYAGKRVKAEALADMLALLQKHGIRLRQVDGTLCGVTFSVAQQRPDAPETLVVGLRYKKRRDGFSEDTFRFTQGADVIQRCYGKKVEKVLPEYEGTHKSPPPASS